jgi:hypothetical protein
LENGRQCLGFSYLDGRIILGGLFMRNFDVQFDRENKKLRMVRSDCGNVPEPNFEAFYFQHSDPRYDPTKRLKKEKVVPSSYITADRPSSWIVVLVSILVITGVVTYSVIYRRYRDREDRDAYPEAGTFNKAEMVFEI